MSVDLLPAGCEDVTSYTCYRGRIDAATEVDAHRNVCLHACLNSIVQAFAKLLNDFLLSSSVFGVLLKSVAGRASRKETRYLVWINALPVCVFREVVKGVACHVIARQDLCSHIRRLTSFEDGTVLAHLPHAFEDRPLVAEPSFSDQALDIPLQPNSQRAECFRLAGNQQATLPNRPEKRLDSEPISCAEQKLPLFIVKHKREFASKMREERDAITLIQSNDQLGIAPALKLIFRSEFCPKFFVVVDFSIDNGVDRVV